jgi:hypothetical protein
MTARGWGRDMGEWVLLNQPLADAKVTHVPSTHSVNMNSASMHVTRDNGINIGWGKGLTLGGNFILTARFTRDEIIQFFKLSVGEIITPAISKEIGLSIDDDLVRDRLRSMTVAQLMELLTSQEEEGEAVASPDAADEVGEAAAE